MYITESRSVNDISWALQWYTIGLGSNVWWTGSRLVRRFTNRHYDNVQQTINWLNPSTCLIYLFSRRSSLSKNTARPNWNQEISSAFPLDDGGLYHLQLCNDTTAHRIHPPKKTYGIATYAFVDTVLSPLVYVPIPSSLVGPNIVISTTFLSLHGTAPLQDLPRFYMWYLHPPKSLPSIVSSRPSTKSISLFNCSSFFLNHKHIAIYIKEEMTQIAYDLL